MASEQSRLVLVVDTDQRFIDDARRSRAGERDHGARAGARGQGATARARRTAPPGNAQSSKHAERVAARCGKKEEAAGGRRSAH